MLAREVERSQVLDEIRERAAKAGVGCQVISRQELDRLAPGNHQGVLAITAGYPYAPLESLLASVSTGVLFADGIMDPQNLGSLIRSALGAGFDGVVIPSHRAASVTPAVRRVSAGAAELLAVAKVSNLSRALEEAKRAGLWIVGLDEKAGDVLWSSNLMEPPVGLVIGAEDRGISRTVAMRCDGMVAIPQRGDLGSLNAAVAGAVAMFEVARRVFNRSAPNGG